MRRLILVLTAMGVAMLLASGVALAELIDGTSGNDTIRGTSSSDLINGFAGDDTLSGLAGSDIINGGDGADVLYGSNEALSISSDVGNDINGGLGKDLIWGGPGPDTLAGGPGADIIYEGPGADSASDSLEGGDGNDALYVASNPARADTTIDCGAGVDDVEADNRDVVSSDCENVFMITPNTDDPAVEVPPQNAPEADEPLIDEPDPPDEPAEPDLLDLDSPYIDDGAESDFSAQLTIEGCKGRADKVHHSRHYRGRIAATGGVWKCASNRKRLYAYGKIQRYTGGAWRKVGVDKSNTNFGERRVLVTPYKRCNGGRLYYYRSRYYVEVETHAEFAAVILTGPKQRLACG